MPPSTLQARAPGVLVALLALLAAIAATDLAAAQDQISRVSLERLIFRHFDRGEYGRAADLIEQHLRRSPNDSTMLYNGACAYSQLGEADRATSLLRRAVESGFRDFEFMQHDPDLAPIHDHPVYQAIVEAARTVSGMWARTALDLWRTTYGNDDYRYEKDDERRLAYATALDETSHDEMRVMLERQSDHLITYLFGSPPSYFVLIAVPTPRDGDRLFDGDDQIGGIYEHDKRRLIARNIGGSLRHEFFHLMHYGHMERLNQPHRLWVQEGLASLYEDYELSEDGAIRFLPNSRHNVARSRAKAGRLMRWSQLFDLDGDQFMARAGQLYPQVRSMFEYVAEQDKLPAWYAAYVQHFPQDPTGRLAFEEAFGEPVQEIERSWRRWVMRRPSVDMRIDSGDAALGVRSGDRLSNDGVLITSVLPGSGADRAGVRRNDVIVAIDEKPTRTPRELTKLIAGLEVGQTVRVRLRRGNAYVTLPVRLQAVRY